MKNRIFSLALLAATFAYVGCSSNDPEGADPNAGLYTEVLTNVSSNVIVETYKTLNERAALLETAIDNLEANRTADNLALVKAAWQATRAPWESSESFLYGPIETEEIVDPAIDSWPVDVIAIDNIIDGGDAITASSLATNNDARGFHTIEYFIWGINSNKTVDQITDREFEFLQAAAEDLQNNTQKLYDAWKSGGSINYVANFINAGTSSSVYPSQKSALIEITEGLFGIADEVANGKIETPLNGDGGSAMPEAEESRFSNNSKTDFMNNIGSIKNMYLGDYNYNDIDAGNDHAGKGLTDIVSLTNPTLDTTIKNKIDEAIAAINAIPDTFTDGIVNNRPAVANAQAKVNELKTLLESQLKPFIQGL